MFDSKAHNSLFDSLDRQSQHFLDNLFPTFSFSLEPGPWEPGRNVLDYFDSQNQQVTILGMSER